VYLSPPFLYLKHSLLGFNAAHHGHVDALLGNLQRFAENNFAVTKLNVTVPLYGWAFKIRRSGIPKSDVQRHVFEVAYPSSENTEIFVVGICESAGSTNLITGFSPFLLAVKHTANGMTWPVDPSDLGQFASGQSMLRRFS
jgi:hypothetical protein